MTLFSPIPFKPRTTANILPVRSTTMNTKRGIPTYRSNGQRVSDSSPERVQRLLDLKMVSVKRHSRTGRITGCQFIAETLRGADPIRKHAHMGQHYCIQRTVGDRKLWQHRELNGFAKSAEDRAQAERFVRKVFLEVPLSCMATPEPPPPPRAPAKVIPFPVRKTDVIASSPERKAA